MKNGKLMGKIFGMALVFVMVGAMLGWLPLSARAADSDEFQATAYYCVYESELDGTQTVTRTISGTSYILKASFLFGGHGVGMQGTGRTGPDGDYIHYTGGGGEFVSVDDPEGDAVVRARYAELGITDFTGFGKIGLASPGGAIYSVVSGVTGASGRTLVPWYSIAVDPSVIPLGNSGTLCFKSGTTPKGAVEMKFRADDTGGAIKGKRIDIYVGEGQAALATWGGTGGNRYVWVCYGVSLDLIFTIDTTGSMWDDIDAVKASASAIVDKVREDIPCARIAVVDYRDFPVDPYGGAGDYPFNDVLSFSTDKSAIVAAIQGLTLGWGADWRESVYSALVHSFDATSLGGWRGSDKAAKVIILMGDAPPHDPEPFSGYTLSSVVTAAENADPVIIYPIQIRGTVEKFEELADQTGGKAFTAEDASEVVDAILEALEEIKTKPVADANGPYLGYVDCPITFDGTGSYDLDGTIVSYEWDLDDDGEFDDATGPTPSKTWGTAYSGNINLKVMDNDGLQDTDFAILTVEVPPNQLPVADAGPDQAINIEPSATTAMVTLDGSGSYDADGDPLTYTWTWDGNAAHGVNPTIELPLGNTTITLVVNDGKVDSEPDTVDITLRSRGCFIATAAYGTPMAEEIQILREFRDEYLLTNPVGQTLVDLYYRTSPPIAEFIAAHPSLKLIVRTGLLPAIAMSTVAVNATLAEKIAILGLLVLVSIIVAIWMISRRCRGPQYT